MALNSLNGLSLTVISEMVLPVLQAKMAPLALYTTDLSGDIAQVGSAVSTRIPSAQSATAYDRATGYAAGNATSSAVTVTLDKHYYYCAGFTDAEVGNLGLSKLQATFIQPAVNAVFNQIQSDVIALITTAYPAAYSASYASFGFAGLTGVAKVLDNSGSNSPRGAWLGTNLFYDVLDDIKGIYSTGADALRAGTVGMLANIGVAQVPISTFGGAGLAGFLGGKDALVLAARVPGIPMAGTVNVQNVTDPASGMTLQLREWYSPDEGLYKLAAVAIYGCSRGNTSSGVRIITTD